MSSTDSTGGEITAQQMAGYVTTFATQRRAIYRWISIGREKKDPPPLGEPGKMFAWWGRCMTHRAPEKILALSKSSTPQPKTGAPAGVTPPPPEEIRDQGNLSTPVDFTKLEGVGLAQSVKQLQLQLAAHQHALFDAMTKGSDEGTIQSRQRNVNVTIDLLRKCEATLDDQRKNRGDLIELADVLEDWGMLLTSLATMRERMAADVVQILSTARDDAGNPIALTDAQVAAVRAAVLSVREREDKLLQGAKHWSEAADVERPAA